MDEDFGKVEWRQSYALRRHIANKAAQEEGVTVPELHEIAESVDVDVPKRARKGEIKQAIDDAARIPAPASEPVSEE